MPHHTRRIHPVLLELFEQPSLAERSRRIIHGLHQPRNTGEYRRARLALKRLLSPACAIVVPLIALLLLSLLGSTPAREKRGSTFALPPPPEPLPRLDAPLKPPVPLPTPPIVLNTMPGIAAPELPPMTAPQPAVTPMMSALPPMGVRPTRSPVVMQGVYQARAAAAGGNVVGSGCGATAATESAVLNALRWLQCVQEKNGSWTLASGSPDAATGRKGAAPAMTGLALLAYLAHGETPNSEEFGITVQRGLEWLVQAQDATGHFHGRDAHDYSHPIATFALCEAYGMTANPLLAPIASRAVQVIVDGQNIHGGWTYNCRPDPRNDLSYMGWCVQALKAASLATITCTGLDEALRRAEAGLIHNAAPGGSFGYTGPGNGHLTGVGVLGLQLLGSNRRGHIARGLQTLDAATCSWDQPLGRNPLYYWYYITQAKRLAGGEHWERWNEQFAGEFVRNQVVLKGAGKDDNDLGYWDPASASEHCKSRVYNTTLCALTLEVYYKVGGHVTESPQPDTGGEGYGNEIPVTISGL